MPTDIAGARDDVMSMLAVGLLAAANADLIPGVPNIVWDDQTGTIDPPESSNSSPIGGSVLWVRAAMRHTGGGQASLTGGLNLTKYTRKGLLLFGVNAPLGDGQKQADAMASVILGCFEGISSPNGVWFRNGRPKEIGVMGEWWLTNVILEFTYDTLK